MVFECLKNKQTNKETTKTKIKIKRSSNRSPCDIFRYSRIVLVVAKLEFRKTVFHNVLTLLLTKIASWIRRFALLKWTFNLRVSDSCFGHCIKIIAHCMGSYCLVDAEFRTPKCQCPISKAINLFLNQVYKEWDGAFNTNLNALVLLGWFFSSLFP